VLKIITADERLRERRGAKILIVGPTGVGKTSLLRTLWCSTTLFVDIEAGDLSVIDLPVPTIRIQSFQEALDLAVRVAGPNPSYPPTASFSEAHFNAAGGWLDGVSSFETIFIDSITALSRRSLQHAENTPEAINDRGKRDLRAVYNRHARQMLGLLHHWQQARPKNIVLVGILEKVSDEFNRTEFRLQLDGEKTSRELPGIVVKS
jgi:hypothetical protein